MMATWYLSISKISFPIFWLHSLTTSIQKVPSFDLLVKEPAKSTSMTPFVSETVRVETVTLESSCLPFLSVNILTLTVDGPLQKRAEVFDLVPLKAPVPLAFTSSSSGCGLLAGMGVRAMSAFRRVCPPPSNNETRIDVAPKGTTALPALREVAVG